MCILIMYLCNSHVILCLSPYILAGGGGAGGDASNAMLAAEVALLRKEMARRRIEELFIAPVKSIGSSTPSQPARSPRPEDRIPLKILTIEYYGLWASTESDETSRMVYTMLPVAAAAPGAPPVAVPFKDAILSHIWPAKADPRGIAQLLHLESGFNVEPRNFLILPKVIEKAFDADDLLLLPFRETSPAPHRGVRVRLHPETASGHPLAWAAGVSLFLPREPEGHVPYMRLLSWKAISALRAVFEGTDECPPFIDLDASVNGSGAVRRATQVYTGGGGKFCQFLP